MWIMTPFGILMPALRPAETMEYGDDCTLQIRARDRDALDYLREHFMEDTLGQTLELPDSDYEYRAYCTPEDFAFAMSEMINDIDYEKFKPMAQSKFLHHVYNRIWSVVADMYWGAKDV